MRNSQGSSRSTGCDARRSGESASRAPKVTRRVRNKDGRQQGRNLTRDATAFSTRAQTHPRAARRPRMRRESPQHGHAAEHTTTRRDRVHSAPARTPTSRARSRPSRATPLSAAHTSALCPSNRRNQRRAIGCMSTPGKIPQHIAPRLRIGHMRPKVPPSTQESEIAAKQCERVSAAPPFCAGTFA
jgi:hypothetical protein